MERKAISVDDDNGVYQFTLGAEVEPYSSIREHAERITVVERLMGWGPWQWAISTSEAESGIVPVTHFVTGASEPRERRPLER